MRAFPAWWKRHWFEPAPLADLAVGRIVLAAIFARLGTSHYVRVGRADDQFWEPVDLLVVLGVPKPDLETMIALSWSTVALLALVAIGLWTRPALVALVPLLLFEEALAMSFGKVSHGTIPVLWALLFFALAPCDRRLSVRAWIQRQRGFDPGPDDSAYARWPTELLYVVLSAFYFSAGFSKLLVSGIRWMDGYTLQYHLLRAQTPLGLELAQSPWLCAVGSALVLLWQLTFPLGLIRRLRPYFLWGGVAFHFGTGLLMEIWFWPVPCLYLLFVPWSKLASELRRRLVGPIRRAAADPEAAYSPGSSRSP